MTRLCGPFVRRDGTRTDHYFTSYRLLPEVTVVHCPDLKRLVRWHWYRPIQEQRYVLGKALHIDWRWPWE